MFRIIAPIAIIALAASCAREIQSDSMSDVFRRYNISIDESTKTELSGTGSKRQVNWSEGDEIKYYTVSKQSSAASTAVNIAGSSAYVEIPRGRNDEFINAVYGAAQLKSSSSTESIMYITSPVKIAQRFTSFADAHVCAAFSDDIENPELKFHNAAPVFKFTSVAAVSKVVFRGNNDEVITGGSNGDLKISYSGGAITTEASSTGGKSVTIATNGDALDFYFAVLPVSFANGITIDCYDADNALIFSKKAGGPINTVSGNCTVKLLNLGNAQDWIASAPPTAVDLGLSVKWASFNVGATKPEEYGDYFAWGEIAPKSEYKWANYQFGTSKNGPFSKYVLDSTYGTIDHKTVLDLADDAAHTAWGDDWRMPTKEEVSELMNSSNCTWTWTTKNGVPGYKVTSRKSGYTANSIFLPANGMKSGYSLSDGGTAGNYWTSSISVSFPYYAISPFFDSSKKVSDNCYRYFGLGVRPVQGAVIPVSSITIPETLTLIIGASGTLSATILPANATYKNLTWTSSDESISMVDANGKVTSVAPGTATITAYSADGGITASCVVSSNQLAESITLDKTSVEMYVGDEPVTLTATILPETTTNKTVTWTSSKTSVVTVDDEGNITAVANGTATITATAKDGSGKSATCSVTVKTHVESVSLNKTEVTLYNGKTTSLTATVLPSNASNKSVTWTSSDDSVATVSVSGAYATVKGIARGNAIITATSVDGEITASCNVTVNQYVQSITLDKTSITMYVGDDPVLLSATISPENASDKSLTWTSSKATVATVDEDGKVTAVANGTATITAKAKDGSGVKATCSVTVYTHVESVSLNKSEISLYEGRTETLVATVSPSSATNKTVEWASNMPSVATVESDGKVTGIKAGTATITVTSVDGGYSATCSVQIVEMPKPAAIDLGLSVKWASCNVGAAVPEEYGDYFAWGETRPKTDYSWSTYKWCNGDDDSITKYNDNDHKKTLEPEDDAATVNMDDSWRTPSLTEWQELLKNCSWQQTIINGIIGWQGVSKINSNSIFLPAASHFNGTEFMNNGWDSGYWANCRQWGFWADCVKFDNDRNGSGLGEIYTSDHDRCKGVPVRAVKN